MIYYITCMQIRPGTPHGFDSDILVDVSNDFKQITKVFEDLQLTEEIFGAELWVKEPGGRKRKLRERKYADGK